MFQKGSLVKWMQDEETEGRDASGLATVIKGSQSACRRVDGVLWFVKVVGGGSTEFRGWF